MSSNCSGLEVARQRPEFLYIVRRFNADIARLSAHEANMGPDDAYPRLLGLGVSCALSVPTPRHPRRQLTHVRPLTASQRLYFIFILVAQKKTRIRRKSLGFTTPTFTGSDCERDVKHGPRQFPPEVQINADSTLLELQGQEN